MYQYNTLHAITHISVVVIDYLIVLALNHSTHKHVNIVHIQA